MSDSTVKVTNIKKMQKVKTKKPKCIERKFIGTICTKQVINIKR